MANLIASLDEQLSKFLSQWDFYTIVLGLAITGFILHTIITSKDPDIHPMILSRQAYADRVRNEGESAIHYSPDAPASGMRTGLDVKLPGDKPYSAGRDGDLRYIWLAVTGAVKAQRGPSAHAEVDNKRRIVTVLGRQTVVDHKVEDVSKDIAVVGSYLQKHGSTRVAVYLPNSIELLSAVFACSFYGLTVILIPFNLPHPLVVEYLKSTNSSALIAPAGSLPLEMITQGHPALHQLIWVVEPSSRHMDWTEIPSGLGGSTDVSVWHELVQDAPANTSLPPLDAFSTDDAQIITVWQDQPLDRGDIISFSHGNFVAAIAAALHSLPASQRIKSSDLFFPAAELTTSYALTRTLAALFAGSSLALSSVSGPSATFSLPSTINPTIVLASTSSISSFHSALKSSLSGLGALSHASRLRSLTAGNLPQTSTTFTNSCLRCLGAPPSSLRLLLVPDLAGTANPPLSTAELNDVRAATGARVVYALVCREVCGAVAQTNVFDYRVEVAGRCHFGAPLGCVRVKIVGGDGKKGEITVMGPAVAVDSDKWVGVGEIGTFRGDGTLAFA